MRRYKESLLKIISLLLVIISLIINGCNTTNSKEDELISGPISSGPGSKAQKRESSLGKQAQQLVDKKEWTLSECINFALKNNEKIKSLKLKKKVKDGEILEAWSDYLPSANFDYTHGNTNETGEVDRYSISGKMLIWACGKIKSKVKKIKAEKAMYDQDLKAEVLKVIYEVRKNFYELIYRKYEVASKKLALDNAKEKEKDVEKKVENGEAREVDKLGIETLVAKAQRDYFSAIKEYELAKKRLNHVMGRSIYKDIIPKGQLTFQQIPLYKDKLIARALNLNPQLKKIEKAMEKAKFSKEAAFRRNFPNFYATAYFEYRDTDKEWGVFGSKEKLFQGRAYGIGVEVELPLFREIGKGYAQRKQAENSLSSLEEEYKKAKREIAYKIEEICTKMEEALQSIHTADLNLKYRNRVVDNILKGLEEKMYQQKDLLEAREKQAEAQAMLMKAILKYKVAKAQLDRILGIVSKD